MVTCVPFHVGL